MEYTVSNTIEKPLDFVVEKFKEPEGAFNWMEGLKKIEPISGEPLTVGAKTDFTFDHKGKEFLIHETILESKLPDSVKFAFESKMGYNEVEIKFEKLSEGSVKQSSVNMFELKGMMKIMGFFGKGMFKKQSMKYLDGFKRYCEN